jgi:hypothetical protein
VDLVRVQVRNGPRFEDSKSAVFAPSLKETFA